MATEHLSVSLETHSGQELPLFAWNGNQWFVGEPGQEYQVAVSRSSNTSKAFKVGAADSMHAPAGIWRHTIAPFLKRCGCS